MSGIPKKTARKPKTTKEQGKGNQPNMEVTTNAAGALIADENNSPHRIFVECSGREVDNYLETLLECPVCFDVILPPIKTCVQGHSCCQTCRQAMSKCPVCRGAFSEVRNLFAEHFLEKCKIKCKNTACPVVLKAQELTEHYKGTCDYRPVLCRECQQYIPYDMFLHHLQYTDGLERQKASECSTGFDISPTDFNNCDNKVIWEPTWISCNDENFFCCLNRNKNFWWIWVCSLSPLGQKNACQIVLWSKKQTSEMTFAGDIHSIRDDPETVLKTGRCLILADHVVKNYMLEDGIDVIVRIEKSYSHPKTRQGKPIQSPLELRTKRPKILQAKIKHHRNHTVAATPVPTSEFSDLVSGVANTTREIGNNIIHAPVGGMRAVGAAAGALIRSGRALFETRRRPFSQVEYVETQATLQGEESATDIVDFTD